MSEGVRAKVQSSGVGEVHFVLEITLPAAAAGPVVQQVATQFGVLDPVKSEQLLAQLEAARDGETQADWVVFR